MEYIALHKKVKPYFAVQYGWRPAAAELPLNAFAIGLF
jgi:hypothetical protein